MPRNRITILSVIAMAALLAMAFFDRNPVVSRAQAYAEEVATSSAVLYVSLRSVNALLSTVQEVEVGGSFIVSGTVQPLKALEPIDDTIERISNLVFFLMVVTGILAVALGPVSATGAGMIVLASGIWLIESRWRGGPRLHAISRHLGWYGAFLTLAVPLAFVVASMVADRMTDTVWQEHNAVVQEITASVEQVDETGDWGSNLFGLVEDAEGYQKMITETFARADELIKSYIAILSVFVFRILILPLLVLGGFALLLRGMSIRGG